MLASLLAGLASGETVAALRRARRAAFVYAIAGVTALAGVGFFVGAIYIWLAGKYGSLHAALILGAAFLFIAIMVLLIDRLTAGSRSRKVAQQRKSDLAAVGVAASLAILPGLLRRPLGLGTVLLPAAAVIAYAIYRENVRAKPRDPLDEG
ncbi:MAG: hypothetical protein KF810_23330 [Rhizobiaceae bacterium]|nr:hypothetical protein [Rhizobiaceae bacterium]